MGRNRGNPGRAAGGLTDHRGEFDGLFLVFSCETQPHSQHILGSYHVLGPLLGKVAWKTVSCVIPCGLRSRGNRHEVQAKKHTVSH